MVRFQKLTRNLNLTLHGHNVHRQQRQLSKFLMRYQQFASHAYCGTAGPVSKMASQQEKAFGVLRACCHRHCADGNLSRIQYPEGPATGHIGTGFSWFPFVYEYKRMLRWFPRLPVATACFSCSPPYLNFLDSYFIFMLSLFHIHVHAL